MQLCLTEYTNLKKCPLVTQNEEYSRDSRLNSFQSGGLKEKKIVSEQQIFNSPLFSPPPRKNTSSLQYQELKTWDYLGEKASLSPMSIQLGVGVTHWRFQKVSVVQCLVVVTSAVLPAGSDSLNVTNQILG